jgi:superfamily I DNA/RNA helicase
LAEKLPRFLKVVHTARNQRSAESILTLANALPVA